MTELTEKNPPATPPEAETIIENATLGDVRPGDYLVWEWSRQEYDRLFVTRLEGTAHHPAESGDWCTESDMCITGGMDNATLTIRRQHTAREDQTND